MTSRPVAAGEAAAERARPAAERASSDGGGGALAEVLRLTGELSAEAGSGRPVAPGSDLERELGLGSLERVELVTRLERAFLVRLGDEVVESATTPAALAAAVERLRREAPRGQAADRRARERDGAAAPPADAIVAAGPAAAGDPVVPVLASGDPNALQPAVPGAAGGLPSWWAVPAGVGTLVEMARFRAEASPERRHLDLLAVDGTVDSVTFDALWRGALSVAAALAARGVAPGDRVALVLPTGRDFFHGFLGVLAAGGVPVPLYPPVRLDRLGSWLRRQQAIVADAGARCVLSDRRLLPAARLLAAGGKAGGGAWTVAALAEHPPEAPARLRPDDLALLQYTSGSTGRPKGVALTHAALLANMRGIGGALAFGPDDVAVSWLPLYHDMGLIGVWLSCYLHGMRVVKMSPLAFLSRPERWLWAFHRLGGTVSPAPNFGYELCCRKVRDEDVAGLDLSRWRSAMNGSEPVRPETVARFTRRFAPYGFRPEAMMPVYGLAESSVAVTFPPLGRPPRIDRVDRAALGTRGEARPAGEGPAAAFVSCGTAFPGHAVRVVAAPGGPPLPERREGRIQFRGPSAMAGYYRQPEATAAVRDGEWIDSGDLGYLADGELFVTGRAKEVLIQAGRKVHPHDLEEAAAGVAGVRRGCVAAFAAPAPDTPGGEGEALVVLAETKRPAAEHAELAGRIAAAVTEAAGVTVHRVELVPPGTLPKTSSGKLRRGETRRRYLDGTLGRRAGGWGSVAAAAAGALGRRAAAAAAAAGRLLYGALLTPPAVAVLLVAAPLAALAASRPNGAGATRRLVVAALAAAARLAGLRPRMSGNPLPAGPAVVVSNHASNLDSLLLTLAFRSTLTFTAKRQVFALPLVGRVLARLGHLPVERVETRGRLAAYAAADEALAAGRRVHFFPESTFTPATGVRPFRLGAFRLAAEHGVPVVPVALVGTRRALRDGRFLLRPARLEVRVLDPLPPPAAGDGFRALLELRDEARRRLAEAAGEPLLDVASAALPPGTPGAPPAPATLSLSVAEEAP